MLERYRRFARTLFLLAALTAACAAPGRSAPISFMVFGDPAEVSAYQQVVAAYHAAHPDRQVDLIVIPSQSEYRTRLAADFAAGAPPDITLLNYRRMAAFASKGALEPIGPYLDQSAVIHAQDFYPEALAGFMFGGQIVCLPQNASSLVVYYNRDLFDAAGVPLPRSGWTWDDFLNAARALTLDADGDGQPEQYGLGVEPSLPRLAPFIWQASGSVVDLPGAPTRLTLDSGPGLEAFRWFVELQVRWHVVPDAVAEQAQDSESRFLSGQTAMFLNSRRGVPTYREAAKFHWDVTSLPVGRFRASVLHSDGYCLSAASREKPAAWAFIEFANSMAGQTLVVGTGRTVPSLVSVAESPAFLAPEEPPASSRVFLEGLQDALPLPVLSTWPEIEELADAEIARAFYGRTSVEEAARAAVERTLEEFKRGVGGEID